MLSFYVMFGTCSSVFDMAIAVREFQECEFGEEKVTPAARKIAHTPYLYAILVICQVDKSWVWIWFFEKKNSELCQV